MTKNLRWHFSLAALALTSGLVYLWDLANGARSEYYAAIAHSMSMSFSDFFFGVLDPAGTITLDKIPGSYWLPAIFVKVFGFSTWSVNAPNAIASVALVIVVAITARRIALANGEFGAKYANLIGTIAGVFVAATPIIAAVARSNQPESMFLLMLALAIDRAVVGLQTGTRKQLIFTGLWIAAAFQMYMIEAWSIWPALILAWLLLANKTIFKKIIDLAIAGSVSALASTAWIIIVSLIPSDSRPYIGGTYSNSPWEMVFGYNALGRFGGTSSSYRSFTPPFSGTAGIFRLFNAQVSGQIAWFILPALVALVLLLWLRKANALAVFIGGSFVTMFLMFSLVAGMHQFYTAALALPMALLVAWLILEALASNKHWILIILGLTSAAWVWWVSILYPSYFSFMPYIGVILFAALLITAVFASGKNLASNRALALLVAGTIALTPAVWAVDTINHPSSINPVAGDGSAAMSGAGGFGGGNFGGGMPPSGNAGGFAGGFGQQNSSDSLALVKYLKSQVKGSPKYLLAVFGAQSSAPIINATGESIVPIGGFDGNDAAPTLAMFKKLVASGDVQFVQLGAQGGMHGPNQGASTGTSISTQISDWVSKNCTLDSSFNNLYRCK
jgi:4-amino-4-deoxy-L-arabinose transferase-like glycosyltransferase